MATAVERKINPGINVSRIIYGFSGEGSGHASRTQEMAGHLQTLGHDIRLASYDRGYRSLKDDFDVMEIEGLTIVSTDNRVSKLQTIRENLKKLPAGTSSLLKLRSLFSDFEPHAVICDFEPLTAYLAEHFEVPLISLDNQHRMRYVKHSVPPGRQSQAKFTRRLIRAMVPWPSVSLITAFVDGETTNDRSFVFPPIVRGEVRDAHSEFGEHTLVYLTSGFDSLLPVLKQFSRETFFVYGYERDDEDGNLQFFRNSAEGFVQHLAACKSVVATAGFTLISEALYLGKPYFALPMEGQYEQELNAWQLQQSGYGGTANPATAEAIGNFFYRWEDYRQQMSSYFRDPGDAIKQKLAELVEDDAALARQFRLDRK